MMIAGKPGESTAKMMIPPGGKDMVRIMTDKPGKGAVNWNY